MKNSLLANVNARLDSFIGQVAEFKDRLGTSEKDTHELKENLEFSQEDIMDLKPCSCRIHEVEEEIEMMCGSLEYYHTEKIVYQAGWRIKVEGKIFRNRRHSRGRSGNLGQNRNQSEGDSQREA